MIVRKLKRKLECSAWRRAPSRAPGRDAEQARLAAEQEQQALEAQQAEEAEKAQAEFEAQQVAMQQAEFEAQQVAAQQAAGSAGCRPAGAGRRGATARSAASVPDWYARAQEKAKKPRNAEKPAQRSRYASALDAAVAESAGHFVKANNIVEHELERSFDIDRDTIREVRAPQWATIAPVQPTVQPETKQSAANAAANVSVNAVSAAEQAAHMQQIPVQEEPAVQITAPQQAVQLDAQVETASADEPAPAAPQTDVAVAAPPPRLLLPRRSPHSSRLPLSSRRAVCFRAGFRT